jgi:hypothetical protein
MAAVKNPTTVVADRSTAHTARYCDHEGAREIRLYGPYADANAARLRLAEAASVQELHVSRLYPIPGGWGWTLCRQCRTVERGGPVAA